jgi:hypothetical protein
MATIPVIPVLYLGVALVNGVLLYQDAKNSQQLKEIEEKFQKTIEGEVPDKKARDLIVSTVVKTSLIAAISARALAWPLITAVEIVTDTVKIVFASD